MGADLYLTKTKPFFWFSWEFDEVSLKTNKAAFRWHVRSFPTLHEDSDILLNCLYLDFFKVIIE